MENLTVEHIIPFVEIHRYTGYFLLFFAMVLEGEVFLIVAGILAHLHAFHVTNVLLIAFSGVTLGNILWYALGTTLNKKAFMQPLITRAEKAVKFVLPDFTERPFKSIFFSKFIYGVNRASVLIAGVLKVPLGIFIKAELLASILWVAIYTSLGYFLGYAAIHLTHKVSHFALLILAFVVGFFVLRHLSFIVYERYNKHSQAQEDRNA